MCVDQNLKTKFQLGMQKNIYKKWIQTKLSLINDHSELKMCDNKSSIAFNRQNVIINILTIKYSKKLFLFLDICT